jgi:hypothetical protein
VIGLQRLAILLRQPNDEIIREQTGEHMAFAKAAG